MLFQFQIYCDFSSYSNIAIGSAQVMGFRLMRNFNAPFFATSISDFWARWHISLSTWLGDYIFVPLVWSGWVNRLLYGKHADEHKPHSAVNYLIVFLISGIWHGANWTFVLWGVLHGVYSVVSHLTAKLRAKCRKALRVNRSGMLHRSLSRLFIFAITTFAHIFFRANSVSDAFGITGRIFGHLNPGSFSAETLFGAGLDRPDFAVAIIAIAILLAVDALSQKRDLVLSVMAKPLALRWTLYLALIAAIVIFGIYGPAYDATPFIYFQF